MSPLASAGFIYGKDLHYLDHLATISLLLAIPLLVTDEEIAALATHYYPHLQVRLLSTIRCTEEILASYDLVFSALPKQLLDPLFFFEEQRQRKKLLSFWVPHGNSDKDNLGALTEEQLLLLYGKQMQDSLKQKGLEKKRNVVIGNLRRHLYLQQKNFFDNKVAAALYFPDKQTTILYAPSWDGPHLKETLLFLLQNLPSGYNLLVKLHPNSLQKEYLLPLKEMYGAHKNIIFLEAFPLIYPLLAQVDLYIGDHSSIAYDFLSFHKPLFFLTEKRSLIHQAGKVVTLETLFSALEEEDRFFEARAALERYAFAKDVDYTHLAAKIYQTALDYLEKEVHIL